MYNTYYDKSPYSYKYKSSIENFSLSQSNVFAKEYDIKIELKIEFWTMLNYTETLNVTPIFK